MQERGILVEHAQHAQILQLSRSRGMALEGVVCEPWPAIVILHFGGGSVVDRPDHDSHRRSDHVEKRMNQFAATGDDTGIACIQYFQIPQLQTAGKRSLSVRYGLP